MRKVLLFAGLAVLIPFTPLTLSGCFSSSPGTADSLPAVYKKFTANVLVSDTDSILTVQSDGIPNHKSPYFSTSDTGYEADTETGFVKNPNTIETQNLTFRIPTHPLEATGTHQSTALGPIGVALNGIPLYNQYAGPNDEPLTTEIVSFDQYNGHPQQQGQYHYHVVPLYLTAQNGDSSLIGFLLDGFPVYGPVENGKLVNDSELDQYHGHFGPTADYPGGIYHYHVTATSPYINGGEFYGTPGTVTQ